MLVEDFVKAYFGTVKETLPQYFTEEDEPVAAPAPQNVAQPEEPQATAPEQPPAPPAPKKAPPEKKPDPFQIAAQKGAEQALKHRSGESLYNPNPPPGLEVDNDPEAEMGYHVGYHDAHTTGQQQPNYRHPGITGEAYKHVKELHKALKSGDKKAADQHADNAYASLLQSGHIGKWARRFNPKDPEGYAQDVLAHPGSRADTQLPYRRRLSKVANLMFEPKAGEAPEGTEAPEHEHRPEKGPDAVAGAIMGTLAKGTKNLRQRNRVVRGGKSAVSLSPADDETQGLDLPSNEQPAGKQLLTPDKEAINKVVKQTLSDFPYYPNVYKDFEGNEKKREPSDIRPTMNLSDKVKPPETPQPPKTPADLPANASPIQIKAHKDAVKQHSKDMTKYNKAIGGHQKALERHHADVEKSWNSAKIASEVLNHYFLDEKGHLRPDVLTREGEGDFKLDPSRWEEIVGNIEKTVDPDTGKPMQIPVTVPSMKNKKTMVAQTVKSYLAHLKSHPMFKSLAAYSTDKPNEKRSTGRGAKEQELEAPEGEQPVSAAPQPQAEPEPSDSQKLQAARDLAAQPEPSDFSKKYWWHRAKQQVAKSDKQQPAAPETSAAQPPVEAPPSGAPKAPEEEPDEIQAARETLSQPTPDKNKDFANYYKWMQAKKRIDNYEASKKQPPSENEEPEHPTPDTGEVRESISLASRIFGEDLSKITKLSNYLESEERIYIRSNKMRGQPFIDQSGNRRKLQWGSPWARTMVFGHRTDKAVNRLKLLRAKKK